MCCSRNFAVVCFFPVIFLYNYLFPFVPQICYNHVVWKTHTLTQPSCKLTTTCTHCKINARVKSNHNEDSLYYEVSCKMTAFLVLYTVWVNLLFTVWLTFHLFSYVVFFKNLKRLEWLYISSSVFGPLLIAWIPFIHNSYGLSGAWCFIRSWNDNCPTEKYLEGIVEEFLLFYGPAFLMVGLCIVAIVTMLSVQLYRARYSMYDEKTPLLHRDRRKKMIKQLLPLLAYPIIYLLILLFPLSNRIYAAVATNTSLFYLVFHAGGVFLSMALVVHLCSVRKYKQGKRREVKDTTNAMTMETSRVTVSSV